MPEQRRPDGAREESQREGRQGLQHGRGGIAFGEKQLGKYQYRGGGVDIEIEELDGGADQAREQNPACLFRGAGQRRFRQGGVKQRSSPMSGRFDSVLGLGS